MWVFFYESLKTLFFVSKKFGIFMLYIEMENRNYKSENMQRKYLKIMQKNQYFAKGKK